AGAYDVLVARLIDLRHRARRRESAAAVGSANTELLDERGHHAHGRGPGAVGRADRLDDVVENGRAAQHPPGAGRGPGELRILPRGFVERREVGVEPEHVARGLDEEHGVAPPDVRALDTGETGAAGADAARPGPGHR